MADVPLMYSELAEWWPLISRPEDYVEESSFYVRALEDASSGPIRSVLELGSGGGNNASHMKAGFAMTLVDLSPGMLEVSRSLNPDLEHLEGDMRTVRLDRGFDAVFVHDAIDYMTTLDDLRACIDTAYVHTRPGGVALLCPDHTKERFETSTEHGGHDANGRGLRYIEWTWDPDPSDATYVTDYGYLMRDADGRVRPLHDRHVCGLFSEDEWTTVMQAAGFGVSVLPFVHSEVERDAVVFVGTRPLRA